MFTTPNRGPEKRRRLLGELGDRSHTRIISSEFKYRKGSEIFGQAEPADYVYQVIEGAVRTHKLLSDGRRQIGAFTAEAVVDTTVRLIKRKSLEREAKNDPAMVRSLLTMTTDNLQHVENHLLLLGRQTAQERVGAFLLEMNGRQTSADVITLPMSRLDIADYLGLTIETVSRVLSKFQRMGYLRFLDRMQRQFVVLNAAGLTRRFGRTTATSDQPR